MRKKQKRRNNNIKLLTVAFVLLTICFCLSAYHLNQYTQSTALAKQKTPSSVKAAAEEQPPHEKADDHIQEQEVKPVFSQQLPIPANALQEQIVYLTFDDGPAPVTQEILDLLDRYEAKATFFMLEPNMRLYPDAVKEMVKQGHAAGMHGVTHNKNKIYRSSQSVVDEMKTAQHTLEGLTGLKSHLIRTPYGSVPFMTPEYREKVKEAEFKMWDWTIDSLDWKFRSQQYVPYVINQLQRPHDESKPTVILLHEKTTTLQHLEQLLQYLQINHYKTEILNENLPPFDFYS
ncbi:polysaccharide deacetylase family protein [Bacillus sp. B190/17]|uniref:Polysaccharide deacetylase family protein n=1 Tax=Bacillus lumedeiriae TaxID=3058829 RepID=A0ABW8I3R2_9BACI